MIYLSIIMAILITALEPKELKKYLEQYSIDNIPEQTKQKLLKEGWEITEWGLTKVHKEYRLYIESCVGDYCVSLGSKGYGWLLELPKIRCETIYQAIEEAKKFEKRINSGETWIGEND